MSKTIIRLIHTDGTVTEVPSNSHTEEYIIETVTVNDMTTLTLTPQKEGMTLTALEYVSSVPDNLLTCPHPESLLIYDNMSDTNDVTHIYPWKYEEHRRLAEMGVIKDTASGYAWLFGLVTLQRFWSSITVHRDTVTFRFELENRMLNAGEIYIMERMMMADNTGKHAENRLLETYGERVASINHAIPSGDTPTGWCSWSCYYSHVNEEKIRRAADGQVRYTKPGQANLIQIDDGWQRCGSFCGKWVADTDKFPSGLALTAQHVIDRGMTFGLWLAPFLIDDRSEYYEELKDLATDSVTLQENIHPFDLGNPQFLDYLRNTFGRMVNEYHAGYFKLDFLSASIRFFNGRGDIMHFKNGFCVEVLRNALQTVRDTVGPDVFLLSCGAPMLIGAGIFNGARTSCDIIWGKNKKLPGYWSIMKDCLKTVSWRYFLHRKVYINDPDGLVLRDIDIGDGFNTTYSETELWAIAIAMSGGSVLSNDEIENLSPGRRRLYTHLLPPLDVPGHPVDFFEQPEPTAYIIDYNENIKFLTLYNLSDKMTDITYDLEKIGMKGSFAVGCLTGKPIGFVDTIRVADANPHSGIMFLIRRPSDKPEFAYADSNIFCGVHTTHVDFINNRPIITKAPGSEHAKVYILWPENTTPVGEVIWTGNGYTMTQNI